MALEDYIAQFRGVSLPQIDQARRQNALGNLDLLQAQRQNAVMANPDATQEQLARAGRPDVANSLGDQQQNSDKRALAARAFLAHGFAAISQSKDPMGLAAGFIQHPAFQQAAQLAGIDPTQFTATPQDDPEQLRSSSMDWARVLGGTAGTNGRVQSTFVSNGIMHEVMADGTVNNTGIPAQQYADRYVDLGPGQGGGSFSGSGGSVTPIITPQQSLAGSEAEKSAEQIGKSMGEQYTNLQASVVPAQGKINRLDRIEGLLAGIDTGKLTPAAKSVAEIFDSFGITLDPNLPALQASQAAANELALQNRNPAGGAGMPGAMSDQDRNFLVSMGPNLAQTPEGRSLIIETGRRLARRDMQIAELARQYKQAAGKFDEFFYDKLGQWSAQHPLFGDMPQPPAQQPTQSASAPAAGITDMSQLTDEQLKQLIAPNGR